MANDYPRRGDVILVTQNSTTRSAIPRPDRPAVIVSNNELNERSFYAVCVWMTKQENERPGYQLIHVPVMAGTPSLAMCEQIAVIHRGNIKGYIRSCTDEEMAGIDAALIQVLALPEPDDAKAIDVAERWEPDKEKMDLQAVIADNEAAIANLSSELNAERAENARLRAELEAKPDAAPAMTATDLAVLRAERDIYAMITHELIKR